MKGRSSCSYVFLLLVAIGALLAPSLTAQSGGGEVYYTLRKVDVDPDKRTGVPSGGPQTWTLTQSGATAVFGVPPGGGTYSVNVTGAPPEILRVGVTFDITITVSAQSSDRGSYSAEAGLAGAGIVIERVPKDKTRALAWAGTVNDQYSEIPTATMRFHCSVTAESLADAASGSDADAVWVAPFVGNVGPMAVYRYQRQANPLPPAQAVGGAGPAPPVAPAKVQRGRPQIFLKPSSGPPRTEVLVTGDGFDPDEDLTLRWDEPTGDILAAVKADQRGNFFQRILIPTGSAQGTHPIHVVAGNVRRAGSDFLLDLLRVRGQVLLRAIGGPPLPGVEVRLHWRRPDGQEFQLGSDVTDARGRYSIPSRFLTAPMRGQLLLQAILQESDFGVFAVADEMASTAVVNGFFGREGRIGANANLADTWLTVSTAADLDKDLWFEDLDDDPATPFVREDHALDAALVYYHTHQAMRVFRELGAPLNQRLNVIVYSNRGTACDGVDLTINAEDSAWDCGEAPKNREWHEFAHYVMTRIWGGFPPLFYEAADLNGNGVRDEDYNHGGYWGNSLTSSDAFTEGFAEFFAIAIADQMGRQGERYANDLLPPQVYTSSSSDSIYAATYNMEWNWKRDLLRLFPQLRGAVHDEEISVASLLWDLYDEADPADADGVCLPLQRIWDILTRTYTFPQYYNDIAISSFTGDGHTYAGSALDRSQPQSRAYPMQSRNIWFVKDLYDALVLSLPDQVKAIDALFFSHDFFMDSFRLYIDPATLSEQNVAPIGDPASQVHISVGPEASHSFWGRGIVADLNVNGWGAGFVVRRSELQDSTGHLYLLNWINAPAHSAFDVVVEDDAGQWLAAGISTVLLGAGQRPADLGPFQRGTGGWGALQLPGAGGESLPFVTMLDLSAAGLDFLHAFQFRPNPYFETPPFGALGPKPFRIKGVGVLFSTPGSYRVMMGPPVFALQYPWTTGMRSMKGINEPVYGFKLPYRRDMRPLQGSLALLRVNEVPATVLVSVEYPGAYKRLNYSYPITIRSKSQEVYLSVEPSYGGPDNTVTLTATRDGYWDSPAVKVTSTQYWQMIGTKPRVLEADFKLVRKPLLLRLGWAPAVGLGGLVAAAVAVFAIQRRRRSVVPPGLSNAVPDAARQFCTKCSERQTPEAAFCTKCGARTR